MVYFVAFIILRQNNKLKMHKKANESEYTFSILCFVFVKNDYEPLNSH